MMGKLLIERKENRLVVVGERQVHQQEVRVEEGMTIILKRIQFERVSSHCETRRMRQSRFEGCEVVEISMLEQI